MNIYNYINYTQDGGFYFSLSSSLLVSSNLLFALTNFEVEMAKKQTKSPDRSGGSWLPLFCDFTHRALIDGL